MMVGSSRPTGAHDHRHEGGGDVRGERSEEVFDDLLSTTRRDVRIGERVAQLVGRLERPGEPEQLVLDLADDSLGEGHVEHRVGIRTDAIPGSFRRVRDLRHVTHVSSTDSRAG